MTEGMTTKGGTSVFGRIWQWYVSWADAMESEEAALRECRVSEIEQEFSAFGGNQPISKMQMRNTIDHIF